MEPRPRTTSLRLDDICRRIWEKDPAIWKPEPAHQSAIRNRLGWLTSAEEMRAHAGELRAFAEEVRRDGFAQVVLLGMGGSSLCAEVLRETFGAAAGFPDVQILDTTDPTQIAQFEGRLDLARTLFLVSSKSGTTTEVGSLYAHFRSRSADPKRFVAVTDPGTPLEAMARDAGFRRTFVNPPDIGGRYSALSYFGLVPAALLGIDLDRFLDRTARAVEENRSTGTPLERSGARLGSILAKSALAGKDKMTLVLSPELASLGGWIEQLVAESTGKEGKGILPIDGEPVGPPDVYGPDRLFVYVRYLPSIHEPIERGMERLEQASHPVVRIDVPDLYAIGGEFFRWEIATAVAGAFLGVNPFDEPNVKESKDLTVEFLKRFKEKKSFAEGPPLAGEPGLRVYAHERFRDLSGPTVKQALQVHFTWSEPGDYAAIQAYLPRAEETERELQAIRTLIRDRRHLATAVGFGPRYLHSTGQYHKGGPDRGVFLQLTCDDASDLPIPGEPYGFSILKQAQALGDWKALRRHGRRVLRVHLSKDVAGGLRKIRGYLEAVL